MGLQEVRSAAQALPEGLREHVERVVKEVRRLAPSREIDPERAELAAWGHDIARALPDDGLLGKARSYCLAIDPVEAAAPVLLHGPVGAAILAREFGVDDEEVLEAVRLHTTGGPAMSPLAQVVFVADKIEPGKVRADPNLGAVRALIQDSLEAAILEYLTQQMLLAARQGWPLHPSAVAARNYLLLKG